MSNCAVRPEPAAAVSATVRVLAIADTDSYLKWRTTTPDALPSFWDATQLLVENPVMRSQEQIRAISGRPVESVSFAALRRRVHLERPDVVLLACMLIMSLERDDQAGIRRSGCLGTLDDLRSAAAASQIHGG